MSPMVTRLIRFLAFLALSAFLDRALDASRFRSTLLNALVDDISTAVGIGSRYIDWLLVSLAAFAMLWTLTTVYRALLGMVKR